MLLPGHDEILHSALAVTAIAEGFDKTISQDDLLHTAMFPGSSRKELKAGLHYPDVPCADREPVDEDDEAESKEAENGRGVGMRMVNHTQCSWLRVGQLLRKNTLRGKNGVTYSEAFVSHKFSMAHMHSMSFNPQLTVAQVRDTILSHAEVCAALAIRDDTAATPQLRGQPSAFWLGRIIHMVQDAYSPSHVLRAATLPKTIDADQMVRVLRFMSKARLVSSHVSDLATEAVVWLIERAAKKLAAAHPRPPGVVDPLEYVRKELVANGIDPNAAQRTPRVAKYTRNLFLAFLGEHRARLSLQADLRMSSRNKQPQEGQPKEQQDQKKHKHKRKKQKKQKTQKQQEEEEQVQDELERLRKTLTLIRKAPLPPTLRANAAGDTGIVSFHCYTNQSPVRHSLDDRISAVNRAGLLAHAVWDTCVLLRMYKSCMAHIAGESQKEKEKEAPARAAIDAARIVFVRGVRAFLAAKTYRLVKPECRDLLTGFDAEHVIAELLQ